MGDLVRDLLNQPDDPKRPAAIRKLQADIMTQLAKEEAAGMVHVERIKIGLLTAYATCFVIVCVGSAAVYLLAIIGALEIPPRYEKWVFASAGVGGVTSAWNLISDRLARRKGG